jgi:hypothetical protein
MKPIAIFNKEEETIVYVTCISVLKDPTYKIDGIAELICSTDSEGKEFYRAIPFRDLNDYILGHKDFVRLLCEMNKVLEEEIFGTDQKTYTHTWLNEPSNSTWETKITFNSKFAKTEEEAKNVVERGLKDWFDLQWALGKRNQYPITITETKKGHYALETKTTASTTTLHDLRNEVDSKINSLKGVK